MTLKEAILENYQHNNLLTQDQVSGTDYFMWKGVEATLYDVVQKIGANKEWTNLGDKNFMAEERSEIFCVYQQIIAACGLIAGQPLRKEKDLDIKIITYGLVPDNVKNATEASFNLFRERLENYIAREILIQEAKGERILKEEDNDRILLRRVTQGRRRRLKRAMRRAEKEQIKSEPLEQPVIPEAIDFCSLVVVCNKQNPDCESNIKEVSTTVQIVRGDGSLMTQKLVADYNYKENVYLVPKLIFDGMRAKGVLLCQVIDLNTFIKDSDSIHNIDEWQPESLLHRSGYNVSAEDNLTAKQRQMILRQEIGRAHV